ncbi:MAG: CHAD domain-containing protein [Geodermatophilaceae bacterium]|nr:CHAD domain-containing protein [Geodermatophilaceae bacterium]
MDLRFDRLGDDAIGIALAPRYQTVTGPEVDVERTWLDTFDWRLHGNGQQLLLAKVGDEVRLEFESADGHKLSAAAARLRLPASVDALPPGPLQEQVSAAAGIRALTPTAHVQCMRREIRLLNDDDKTVARLRVEHLSGHDRLFTVSALRGYEPDADRIRVMLGAIPGADRNERDLYDEALRAVGRHAGDYSGKVDLQLDGDRPAEETVRLVLDDFRVTLEANLPGVLSDVDTEFLHDLRVAVRRARSTVKLTGDVLPHVVSELLQSELKWLGDLTTPTRDLDVYRLSLAELAQHLRAADASDLTPFRHHLEARRRAELRRLVRGLRSRRFERVLNSWATLSNGDNPRLTGHGTTAELARARLGRAHRRVVRLGSTIDQDSPAERLHDLRKRCKELRYLLEIFASLHDKSKRRGAVQVLKGLQECLGDFQDSEVQRLELRRFAAEMMETGTTPPATILAMGELAAQLHTVQQRAREEFLDTFQTFMKDRNQHSFAQLTGWSPG